MVAHEDELREAGRWPEQPGRRHLAELAHLARDMGWLREPISEEITSVLNVAWIMAAHPGAYVRGMRQVPDLVLGDPAGYGAVP
ncbi:hypothetical protein AB0D38_00025 [Streptomyces sp. NPDC048279]|uniref:hypothetical protein n=1 Tax=Streptomyces sp. NPDC048279 TaxID=3154714 RepID=UPI00341CAC5A